MRRERPRAQAPSRRRANRQPATSLVRGARKAAVENLEQRQLLCPTSDGFTAHFCGAQYVSVAAFPSPDTEAGDYSTHLDIINDEPNNDGNAQAVAPPDASSNFNSAQSGGVGDEFSGLFTTNVVVQTAGYFTFYPTTDDGAQINVDANLNGGTGTPVSGQNLGASRAYTQDTDAVGALWAVGSTHEVQLYYNPNGLLRRRH